MFLGFASIPDSGCPAINWGCMSCSALLVYLECVRVGGRQAVKYFVTGTYYQTLTFGCDKCGRSGGTHSGLR